MFPYAMTPPPQKRSSEYEGLTHVRLVYPVSPSTGYDSERPHRLTLYSPVWTPESHGPTSTVIRSGEHTPSTLCALLGFGHESTRASPYIPRVAVGDQRVGGMEPGVATL